MSSILDRDTAEAFKGSVHATSLALVAVMFAYNAAAFQARGKADRHLLVNIFVYGLVAGFEVYQTARHWQRVLPDAPVASAPSPRAALLEGPGRLHAVR